MGATIAPNFNSQPVAWTRVECEDCHTFIHWQFEERYEAMRCECPNCNGLTTWPEFYPTEFKWESASWRYGHLYSVLTELELLKGEEDYWGTVDPEYIITNLHKLTDPNDRETLSKIANLAIKLKVDITWG